MCSSDLWKRPRLGFLAAWFFVILAPTSSVLPIVSEVAAERRMYLPLLAVIVPVAWALCRARSLASFRGFAPSAEPASRRGAKLEHDIELRALQWRQPLVGVVVVALACVTWARNQDYRTEVSIMSDTVVKRPHNTRALTNLGVALVRAGKMELAVPHLENAIRLNPRQADAHFNLAMIRAEQKRWADAERHLRMVVELEPGNERARAALATVRRLMQ